MVSRQTLFERTRKSLLVHHWIRFCFCESASPLLIMAIAIESPFFCFSRNSKKLLHLLLVVYFKIFFFFHFFFLYFSGGGTVSIYAVRGNLRRFQCSSNSRKNGALTGPDPQKQKKTTLGGGEAGRNGSRKPIQKHSCAAALFSFFDVVFVSFCLVSSGVRDHWCRILRFRATNMARPTPQKIHY